MGKDPDLKPSKEKPLVVQAKPTRKPLCGRCQNHGEKVRVRFHKNTCRFRSCVCHKCILVSERQQIMKVQTRQRRERQQYELILEMKKNNDSETPSIETPNVEVPPPQTMPTLVSHAKSSKMSLYEPELNTEQVEHLLGYSARLLQQFGYFWESLSLMYVILKDCGSDAGEAIQRIQIANREIQAAAQLKASLFGRPYPYYGNYGANLSTLGNPTYFGSVPYVGMALPPTSAQLGLVPYNLDSHIGLPKVPSSPDSQPERPSSYPDFTKTCRRPLNGSLESMLEPSDKGVHAETSPSFSGFKLDKDFMKIRKRALNISMESMMLEPPKGACAETSPGPLNFKPSDTDLMKSRKRALNISMESMLAEPPNAHAGTSPSLLGFRPLDSDASNQSSY